MKLLGFYDEKPYVIDVPRGIVDTCERVPLGDSLRCAVILNDGKPITRIPVASDTRKRGAS